MNIDLTQYVVAKWGRWFLEKESFSPNELRLGSLLDGVTLAGPLCIRVSVQARNAFTLFGTSAVALQARDVFSYKLDIPPGQTWTYPAPRALRQEPTLAATTIAATPAAPPMDASGATLEGVPNISRNAILSAVVEQPGIIVDPILGNPYLREPLWGANAGFGVAIRLCGPELCADPCAPDPCRPVDPCAPKKKDCGCGGGCGGGGGCGCECGCQGHPDDLPCDFATGRGSHLGMFFPAACEPCTPGAFVGMPPSKGPSLMVPAARGGTVRTRYFNGMFITKEDLWTDQNNNRIKHALMNRAMGQGVVWGLGVGLDGDAVCVLPGYGVDCCGNDVVVSSPYRVDSQMLVRDPAAASTLAKGNAQRMNLLLEYFECPEEPRPVHGDPCAPESSRCEMSRIRETARLRLVPPREVDDSGCIKDFLNEVRKLKGDPVTGPLLNVGFAAPLMPMPIPAPAPSSTPVPATDVPFRIFFKSPSSAGSLTLDPKPGTSVTGSLNTDPADAVLVALQPLTGAAFLGGRVDRTEPAPGANVVAAIPPGGAGFSNVVPFVSNAAPGGVIYNVKGWSARAGDGSEYSGDIRIVLQRQRGNSPNVVAISITTDATVKRPAPTPEPVPSPTRLSCLSEACDPDGRARFPLQIPWLHEDPGHPGQAADPKVIVLAILYAVVVSKIAQTGPGTTPEVVEEQETLAKALNLAAWKLFYDDVPDDERLSMIDALRRLFQCWCKSLLYPGPRCECGCEPHGVVVGCALVEGGTLRMVDPWGGRRWVVHYPLLAYWGKQFGIQPLDALASKFFDLICCVAHLYPARDKGQVLAPGVARPVGALVNRAPVVPLGTSALVFDQPANVPAHLAEMGVTPERTITVGPVEFISRVAEALNSRGGPAAPGTPVLHYTVSGLPELNFVTPAAPGTSPAMAPAPAGGQPVAPRPVGPPTPSQPTSRFSEMVRAAIASRPARSAVPPLLRDFAETLTRRLLETMPLDAPTEAERSVRDALVRADIRSVAELLDSHPEDLHVDVLNRANATGLAGILEASEKTTTSVAKAVGDTVQKLVSEGRLVSRDDFRVSALVSDFRKALTDALKGALSEETVGTEIDRAAGNVV